ncbi:MAG: polyphosphate kinase 1 [Thermoguttaceae bacterium]|nr:polyphosphate kinase 1 [Thermoguttaceae bacterium]
MSPKKHKIPTGLPDNFIARDLSWLAFNERVLQEALDEKVPFAERLRFLAISSSNLDEFFRIRMGNALQRERSGLEEVTNESKEASGLLNAISTKTHALLETQSNEILEMLEELPQFGLSVSRLRDLNEQETAYLRNYLADEILPVLTPLAIEDFNPMPILPALQLHVALRLRVPASISALKSSDLGTYVPRKKGRKKPQIPEACEEKLAVVPVPDQLSRLVRFHASTERTNFVFLEEIIAQNADLIFPGCEVLSHAIFRITRDEDVSISAGQTDYLQSVENAVISRKRQDVVRLEISEGADVSIRRKLAEMLNVQNRDIYDVRGPLDAGILTELAENFRLQSEHYPDWKPVTPADLKNCADLYERIAQSDVLLFMPYERFTPVVDFLERAASDPNVFAIKQTLYRTSGNSPIVKALIKAAQNGKEVTVLVELRARFDESRNLRWTQQLEDAGCHVIYGIAGFKTHAKALLIIRREKGRIVRYAHLSTGNYNDKTAKLYSDIALMTCNPEITADIAAFFNILTGYSEAVGWNRLTVEPGLLRRRFIELIEREITVSTPEQPGCIRAKMNALEDKGVIEALYRASQRGVKIQLNVRGICCLKPGIPGLSENIQVFSIIDRFLEHARIFYFQNAGDPEVYLASADWMTRNLDKRLEILFPVLAQPLKKRILNALNLYLADNQKSHELQPDGTWKKRKPGKNQEKIRAQEILYRQAVEAANAPSATPLQYIPLQKPEK